jgi:hypothetical protein
MLTEADVRLIEKRRGVIRYPLLVNPWKLDELIQSGVLGRTSAESLATMAPLLVILVQLLVIVVIGGGLAMLYRERRLLDLIDALRREGNR